MPRHVVATFLIGTFVGATLVGLYQTPIFKVASEWLFEVYQNSALEVAPDPSLPLQFAVVALIAYGVAWVTIDTPSSGARVLFALLVVLAVLSLSLTLAFYGLLFEPLSGIAAAILSFGAGFLYARSEPGKRRHTLNSLLSGRADPALIRRLTEAKHPLKLDAQNRASSALTCRIINHGELSASLTAQDFAKVTQRFHSLVCTYLIGRGGVLDADSPDCTRAYFGLIPTPEELATRPKPEKGTSGSKKTGKSKPRPKPNQKRGKKAKQATPESGSKATPAPAVDPALETTAAVGATTEPPLPPTSGSPSEVSALELSTMTAAACKAALELSPHLHNLSRECEAETGHRLVSGIGIECGQVTTCFIDRGGSDSLGAVGTVADFTLRLSAANGPYGSDILVGPQAFQAARESIEVRPLEMLYNSATRELDEIYELIDEKGLLSEHDTIRRQAFWEGIILLRQGFPEDALERFTRAKDGRRHDPPLNYFMDRAKTLRESRRQGTPGSPPAPHHARDTASF